MGSKVAGRGPYPQLRVRSEPVRDVSGVIDQGVPPRIAESEFARVPPSIGGPLTERDYEWLAVSWITRELADLAMLRRVDTMDGRDAIGHHGKRDCAGLIFPYYLAEASHPHCNRLRPDIPDWKQGKDGTLKPEGKYLSEPGAANRLYFPPGVRLAQLADSSVPIVIVEGEKKALALQRLAYHDVKDPRFIPIAIAGVWNWRGTIGKTGGPRGERVDIKGPINDLNRIEWAGRTVFILFDTNVHTNDSVKWARKGIARELASRRAEVRLITLPEHSNVNGVDDLLVAWGPARVLELFANSASGSVCQIVQPPQFQSYPEGMFRVTTKGEQLSQVQLTNFQAAIATNIRLDDGVNVQYEFEILSELVGRRSQFTIPASEFARMDWPIERMGSAAIIFPNQRDYARTAIQSCSLNADDRCVYTHTGWRKVDGRWIFLHAGGAICGTGAVSDVNVRLSGPMSLYQLHPPTAPDALLTAVKASLRLLDLAPPSVSFPLLAATYRAVFGDTDFALHVTGETGVFKSEVTALHQQHFGSAMDRRHLPGSWSSTGNSLEALAFQAKDTLLTVDDFAPQGNTADVARYHAAADRVFRAAGNHAGRGRLDSTASLRDPKPPRTLILSTGEDIPRGHSIRARLLVLELSKGSIKPSQLSGCQSDAHQGLYAQAMGGFVQWLAGRYDEARAAFDCKVSEYRASAVSNSGHARTPDIVSSLQAGFAMCMEFAVACRAVDNSERTRLTSRCWAALSDASAAQASHQVATEPAARFLELLRSVLTSGRAHLQACNGGEPNRSPESCGWRRDSSGPWSPMGDCIGWVKGDHVYLEPTAAYRVVQNAGRDIGDVLAVTEQTLNKRLHEKGFLASVDAKRQTLVIRKTCCGSIKSVLDLRRDTLLPEPAHSEDDVE
jgi:hypothetical protein